MKAGRVAAEGLIDIVIRGTKGVLIEVNPETDFVARKMPEMSPRFTANRMSAPGSAVRNLSKLYPAAA